MNRIVRSVALALVFFVALPLSGHASSGPAGFADLAEKLLPAVVNISTTQTITSREDMPDFEFQFPEGSPFEQFFKDFMEQHRKNMPNGKMRKEKATSLGSGFIIDPTGYVVTNNHVIQDADEITVILQDDTNLKATVIGRDKRTDLALLKVQSTKPLTAVSFGDSDKTRVGDWIIAIGNPYGLGGTVTAGIISARARDINSGPYDDYLQTDASINRGNSGGPMFNMDGQVIGVNTAIFSPTGGSVGIGFAVPANMAKGVIEQLKTSGHIRRGWLGVRIQTVTPEIAQSLGMREAKGALVSGITKDGPAADAQIKTGDVIVNFDGKDISEMHRLPRIVAETDVNKTVNVTVLREGKEVSLKVKVGELKAEEETEEKAPESKEKAPPQLHGDKVEELGVTVSSITSGLRKKFDLADDAKGVVILSVSPDGAAAENGLQPGDVIVEASQQNLKTGKDLAKLAKDAQKAGKPLLILVDRSGDMRFLALSLSETKKN